MTIPARIAVMTYALYAMPVSAQDVAPATDTRVALVTQQTGTTVTGLPTDRELVQRAARIGKVQIGIENVFEAPELSAPYRLANGLHISTHDATVRQQLLFHSGDAFDRRVLDESERLLREQRYLGDASIETLHYNDDNTVDVIVRVHDVWTMSPGLSFGRKGGENSSKFKFEDTNFLGLGKQVSLARSDDVDRSAWRLGYVDPNVFGSWWRLSAAHSTLSDGAADAFELGRPFYSLDSRWSASLSASDADSLEPRYSLGRQVERFGMREQLLELRGGISAGLQEGWTKRLLFGVRYDERTFAANPQEVVSVLPEDRRYVYPWVGMEWIEDGYITTHNLNQIGRTEDLYLGRSLRVSAGYAPTAFGSTRNAFMLTAAMQAGHEFEDEQYLINTVDLSTRAEGGTLNNSVLDIGSRYYRRQSEHRVLFAALDAALTSKLDPEQQLLLGGDTGLRGYPLRYQAGTSRALLTLEERFYTNWQPFRLANVGAAIFVDTGRTWGRDEVAAAPAGWLTDVGVGLRLGSARSGLGNILHVDLAMPLNRANDIDSVQLTVETKRSF